MTHDIQGQGVPASPSLSHPSGAEPVPVSGKAGIANAGLLSAATNAAAMLGAVYQWLDMVKDAGGPFSLPGVAKCNAMLNSLERNRTRAKTLVMEPLRAALKAASVPE